MFEVMFCFFWDWLDPIWAKSKRCEAESEENKPHQQTFTRFDDLAKRLVSANGVSIHPTSPNHSFDRSNKQQTIEQWPNTYIYIYIYMYTYLYTHKTVKHISTKPSIAYAGLPSAWFAPLPHLSLYIYIYMYYVYMYVGVYIYIYIYVIWYNMLYYNMICYNITQYTITWHDMIWYNMIYYTMIQYNILYYTILYYTML